MRWRGRLLLLTIPLALGGLLAINNPLPAAVLLVLPAVVAALLPQRWFLWWLALFVLGSIYLLDDLRRNGGGGPAEAFGFILFFGLLLAVAPVALIRLGHIGWRWLHDLPVSPPVPPHGPEPSAASAASPD